MRELEKRIWTVLELIDMLGEVLIGGTNISNEELIPVLSNGLLELLPDIVDAYEQDELQEYQEEIPYWVNQLERLLDALQGDDKFFLYDVLIMETKTALLEFNTRIESVH